MHSTIQVESQYCPSPRRPNSLELTSCLTLEMDNDLENNNNSINNNNNNENNDSPFNRNHNSSRNKKKRRKAADIPEKQFNGKLWKMIFFLFFYPMGIFWGITSHRNFWYKRGEKTQIIYRITSYHLMKLSAGFLFASKNKPSQLTSCFSYQWLKFNDPLLKHIRCCIDWLN